MVHYQLQMNGTRRCHALSCRYALKLPARHVPVPCRRCNFILYCSTECEESHWKYGHALACEHVKAAAENGGVGPSRDETAAMRADALATISRNLKVRVMYY